MDMANASSTISVGVNLQLQNLQDTVKQMQNAMKGVNVNSAAYKEMNKYLQEAQKKLLSIQSISETPITNEAQFKTLNKEIDSLRENLTKVGLKMSELQFPDLKLFPDEQSKIENVRKEIERLKKDKKGLGNTAKDELFKDGDIKKYVDSLGSTLSNKEFNQIFERVGKNLDSLIAKTQQAEAKLSSLQTAEQGKVTEGLNIAGKIQSGKGKTLREMLPQEVADIYLTNTSNGRTQYKAKQKQPFIQRLVDLGIIPSDADLKTLEKYSATEMANYLSGLDLTEYVKKLKSKDKSSEISKAQVEVSKARSNEQEGQKVFDAFNGANEKIKIQAEADDTQIVNLENTLKIIQQLIVDTRNALNQFGSGSTGMALITQQANDLQQAVDQSRQSFSNLSQTMGTFDKLKGTIASFMGFGQVMRIVQNAVRNAINHIKELDTVMNQIAVVTDFSQDELWDQISSYSAIAKQYAVSIQGVYQVSQIYY